VPGEASIVRLRVVLTAQEMGDLQQVASDNRVTISEVVREAVNEYVNDYRERRVFSRTRGAARAKTETEETVCDG
jgi:Arc/MetJ-type ribon-helix-helix transcriptional regulator